VLRIIVEAPWYVPSTVLHKDLGIPTIREDIKNSSKKYKDRLQTHPNDLATNLLDDEGEVRRLKNSNHPIYLLDLISIILLNFN
jgi:hypothetical protein